MNEPLRLYESLFILYKCNRNISNLLTLILQRIHQENANEEECKLLAEYLQMEAVSFLAEYNENLSKYSEEEYKQRISDSRKITKPILKRINKWKDLSRYRNNIIAHPWREAGKFVIPNNQGYNVPKSWLEITVLGHYLQYIWSMIGIEFRQEIKNSLLYMEKTYPYNPVKVDFSGLNQDQYDMAREVHSVAKELGKKYRLRVMLFETSE